VQDGVYEGIAGKLHGTPACIISIELETVELGCGHVKNCSTIDKLSVPSVTLFHPALFTHLTTTVPFSTTGEWSYIRAELPVKTGMVRTAQVMNTILHLANEGCPNVTNAVYKIGGWH
jgi:hypothetical protein